MNPREKKQTEMGGFSEQQPHMELEPRSKKGTVGS